MTLQLSNDAVTQFETEVQHVFQPDMEDIQKRVRVRAATSSKIVQFPLMGKSITQKRQGFHTSIPVDNTTHAPVQVTVQEWTVADYTDIFLQAETNYDERQELAKSQSMAMKRRMLQLVIDALVTANLAKTVAKNVSGSNDNLSRMMLKEAMRLISLVGAPKTDRTFLAHTNGLAYLTNDQRVGSSDWNTNQVIATGEVGKLWAFGFLEVNDMDEGGLPLATNDRTNFGFQKGAVGLAVNMQPRTEVWYDGDKGAHKVTSFMNANAALIDATGACKVTSDESVA